MPSLSKGRSFNLWARAAGVVATYIVVFCVATTNNPAEAGLQARISPAAKWFELRSANFLIVGEVVERKLREVARRLEEFREALSRLISDARFPATPTVVVVFPNQQAYRPFAPVYNGRPVKSAGFFQAGADVNYVAIVLDSPDPYGTVFHEFTHLFVGANLRRVPLWFSEGLAEFYSSFQVSDDGRQAAVGRPIERHVLRLRDNWLPLKEILEAGPASPLYSDAKGRDMFYAESWALTHFLLVGPPSRTAELFEFLHRLDAGATLDDAAQQALGMSVAALDDQLRTYLLRTRFKFQIVIFPEPLSSRTGGPARPLTDAATEARLGDLLWHMERYDEAQARLDDALRLEPGQLFAQQSAGEMRQRRELMASGRVAKRSAPPPGRDALPAAGGGVFYLRAVSEGEQRTYGSLERIECESARVRFHVRSADTLLHFTASGMEAVQFLLYRQDLNTRIECGPRVPPDPVYLTWRPSNANTNGEAVAVEFLPKNYVPMK